MARAPTPPSVGVPLVDKDGRLTVEWYKYLTGGVKFSQNVNSGVTVARQEALAAATAAAQAQGTANGAVAGVNNLAGQTLSFSASYAPSSAHGEAAAPATITTNSVTVTPTGGTGPYTYAWSITGADISINSPTAATTTFVSAASVAAGVLLSQTATCVVTDSLAATAQCVVGVTIYGEPDVTVSEF